MPKIPPEGRRFKPGNNANPLGAAAHNKDLKRVRRLTKEQVAEVGSLILEGNLEALQAVKADENASVLKTWFASVAVKAISKGDAHALSVILDRIVGKVKDQIQFSVDDEIMTEDQAKERLKKMVNRMQGRNGIPEDTK